MMTMLDNKCDVCHISVEHGADPEWIFDYLLKDVADVDQSQIVGGLMTLKNGKYISFHDWAKEKV